MTVFHRKWKFIFDWQLIDASAAIQNDFRGKGAAIFILSRVIDRSCQKRSLSVDVIFLLLESGYYLSYYFAGNLQAAEMSVGWLQKAKKEENSEDKKSMTVETRCSLATSDKVYTIRSGPSDPSKHEESIGASTQNILRTKEIVGYWMFGLILIAVVTVNRQTIVS